MSAEGKPPIPYAVRSRGGQPYTAPGENIYADMVTENVADQTYGVDEFGFTWSRHDPGRVLPGAMLRPGQPFGLYLAPAQRELDRSEGQ